MRPDASPVAGPARIRPIALLVLALALIVVTPAPGQESASYRLSEHAFNAGGHPAAGTVPTSASHRISLDAIGDAVLGRTMSSASYRMDSGLGAAFPPPGEVLGVYLLDDDETLGWAPEKSAGVYNVYRDLLGALSGSNAGACEQWGLPDTTTTDTDAVPVGDGYFYLVTVENGLGEEGTRGFDDTGARRPDTGACP